MVLVQRHHADIVNLYHRRGLPNQELKPKIRRLTREKLDHVICECSRRVIARVDRIHRLLVDLDTDETLASGAFVEIGAEAEVVRDAGDGGKVLVQRRGVRIRLRGNRSGLIELVGEAGGVTGRSDGVRGAGDVLRDPRSEPAFEASVGDGVVDRTAGSACWASCR